MFQSRAARRFGTGYQADMMVCASGPAPARDKTRHVLLSASFKLFIVAQRLPRTRCTYKGFPHRWNSLYRPNQYGGLGYHLPEYVPFWTRPARERTGWWWVLFFERTPVARSPAAGLWATEQSIQQEVEQARKSLRGSESALTEQVCKSNHTNNLSMGGFYACAPLPAMRGGL